ncbi:universal stress protein [Hymenobacter sp. BT491]|uniref:universal stress protein n=1 Tax=Hymenobacter sp. BT491 TaxID=2766779 RepID=UPI0016536A51|nr:universal stress protein [Hymenobacter sp. BT491]MBC6991540.1 universal stress protein [Hymenobacter sp. BT491]
MTLSAILCPLDFSSASVPVVAYAAALAAATGAELRLVHVLEPQPVLAQPDASPELNIPGQLAAHQATAERAGARVKTVILEGDAAVEIVAEARRHPADLIVIGAHGQTGLTRFLMGNTAEVVVRTAPCATLLVKAGPADEYRQSA